MRTALPLVTDRRARPLRDLRISVTDRCNFRCGYCMPAEVYGESYRFLPKPQILTFEEIERLARLFAAQGVRKLRVTGGEPLVRAQLPDLIERLAALGGIDDLALTTNGYLLGAHAEALAKAGLRRVTVSLDSIDPVTFEQMNGRGLPLERVIAGIDAAARAGLTPIKINCVVQRGVNDAQIPDLVRHFRGSGHVVRFIEYMDVGTRNGWNLDDVVGADEMLERLGREFDLVPLEPGYRGEVARRWAHADGSGEIGLITSVTQPFCGDCTRARLSADGSLYTCLFAEDGLDLKTPLRDGASDEEVGELISSVWRARDDRYSEQRSSDTSSTRRVEMYHIGG